MGGINSENRKTKRQRPKSLARLAACSAAFLAAGTLPVQAGLWNDIVEFFEDGGTAYTGAQWDPWVSEIYPEDWEPGDTFTYTRDSVAYNDLFLHDFSYAGYYYGERGPMTNVGETYDVTHYGADPFGLSDSTDAIQSVIDAAGNAGGGIVYLPAGTYHVSLRSGKDYALWLNKSNVILRGDGEDTKLVWTDRITRNSDMIRVSPYEEATLSWGHNEIDPVSISYTVPARSTSVWVDDTSEYSVGDWVVLRTNATQRFSEAHGIEDDLWVDDPDDPSDINLLGRMYLRQITDILPSSNANPGLVSINVPTRYELHKDDLARMYKVDPLLENIGLEDFKFGALENDSGGTCDDRHTEGECGYNLNNSNAIKIEHTMHSWVRNLETFAPSGNDDSVHIHSRGILATMSSFMTFDNLKFSSPQSRAAANGYLFQFRGGDNILKNSSFQGGRHNVSINTFWATGNVILNTVSREGSSWLDFHRNLSAGNLIDSLTLFDESLKASYHTVSMHGHTSTTSVFWNTKEGEGSTDNVVYSQQYGWGYVVGTADGLEVNATEDDDGTAPADYTEGLDQGATLWPQSLYVDQFRRRLARGEILSKSLPYSAFNNSGVTNYFNDASTEDFGGMIDPPQYGAWTYDTKGGSVYVADFPSESDKSLLLVDINENEIVRANKYFVERSTPISVEFKVYRLTDTTSYFNVLDDDTLAARIKIQDDKIRYTDGNGNGGSGYKTLSNTSPTEEWIDFKMIVDPQTDTADFYFDGTLVASGAGFVNDVGSVNRFSFQHQSSEKGQLYFDDLKIRSQ